jgi:cytoskeletal protein RodZ
MASRIGKTLRHARTARGVELEEVERATKVRVKFLAAMEEDRWEELPAPAYARGFLDIYARYLGLDQKALLEEYSRTVEGAGHEPIPESVIKPGTLRQNRPVRRGASINWGPVARVAAGLVAAVIVGLIIVGSIGGSDNGGGGKKKGHPNRQAVRTTTSSTTTTSTSTTPSGEVSVELRATADVWVCLVDDSGNPKVDGETLTADEKRGPFSAAGFEVTLGNGSVDLTVNGQPESVPSSASPLVYRITPSGLRTLVSSSAPTCT